MLQLSDNTFMNERNVLSADEPIHIQVSDQANILWCYPATLGGISATLYYGFFEQSPRV